MNKEEKVWATKDELRFIDYLAADKTCKFVEVNNKERKKTGKSTVKLSRVDIKKRLKGYIQSCHKRNDWHDINGAHCEMYAQALLAEL